MKKIASILCLSLILFTACEGDQGLPGPPGLNAELASVYEINVNFNPANNFAIGYTFPQSKFDADNVLVYRLEKVVNGNNVWEPLPTADITFDDGNFLQYRFNFTKFDVDIIIDSKNPATLDPNFLNNQYFRIVVIPSRFKNIRNQTLKIDELLSLYDIDPKNIIKVSL